MPAKQQGSERFDAKRVVNESLAREFRRLVAAVYPHFKGALSQCGINGPEFFVLLYVSEFGKPVDGEVALPLGELVDALKETGLYTGEKGVRVFIDALIVRALLKKIAVSRAQKRGLFPGARGYSTLIALDAGGRRTLDRVHQDLAAVFTKVTARVPSVLMVPLVKAFAKVVSRITQRLESLRRVDAS